MTRYILDTGIAQLFVNRRTAIIQRADAERHQGNKVGICTPVLGELWSGVECSISRERNLQRLSIALSRLVIWPYTNEAAEEFGRVFASLRRIGRPIQTMDMLIAAIAISLGNSIVVSMDSDLSAVPGLTVENWSIG